MSGSDEQSPTPGERGPGAREPGEPDEPGEPGEPERGPGPGPEPEPGQDEAGADDASGTPAPLPGSEVAPEDDLAGFQTSMARFFSRTRVWLGAIVVVAMLIPVGGWVIDRYLFLVAGESVEDALGDEAELTAALRLVRSVDCRGSARSGSAFALEVDGGARLVTNRHVVEDARSTVVQPLEGGPGVQVREVRVATSADVAVLVLDQDELPPPLPLAAEVRLGQPIRTIGFPGARPAFRAGRVDRLEPGRMLIALEVGAGASGSPVLDEDGAVVGQVYARTEGGRGVATPFEDLIAAVRDAVPAPSCG